MLPLTEGSLPEEAATRVGRLDWQGLLAGAFLGLFIDALVPEEAVRGFLGMVVRGLAVTFGLDLPEIPG